MRLLLPLLLAVVVSCWGPVTHETYFQCQYRDVADYKACLALPSFYLFAIGSMAPDALKSFNLHNLVFAGHQWQYAHANCSDMLPFAEGFAAHIVEDAVGHHPQGYLNPSVDHPQEFAVDTYATKDWAEKEDIMVTFTSLNDTVSTELHAFLGATSGLELADILNSINTFDHLLVEESLAIPFNVAYKFEMIEFDTDNSTTDFNQTLNHLQETVLIVKKAIDYWIAHIQQSTPSLAASSTLTYIDSLMSTMD